MTEIKTKIDMLKTLSTAEESTTDHFFDHDKIYWMKHGQKGRKIQESCEHRERI
jgi:hypothetical protein